MRSLRGIRQFAAVLGAVLLAGAAPSPFYAQNKAPKSGTPQASASGKTTSKSGSNKKKSQHSKKRRAARRGQSAPTLERIKEIQSAIARAGYYSGELTGKWDAATVAAMKEFQGAQGMKATGKLDALSLQKLGLG